MTLVDAAATGSLKEFKGFYKRGTANMYFDTGESLLLLVVTDTDPVQRVEKANFLLDRGADASYCDPRDGMNVLHILAARYAGRDPISRGELDLLRRVLDAGADINQRTRGGSPLMVVAESAIRSVSEDRLVPVYEIFFARDGIDLFTHGKRPRSSVYMLVSSLKSHLPLFWGFVERYVVEHGLVVPEDQVV